MMHKIGYAALFLVGAYGGAVVYRRRQRNMMVKGMGAGAGAAVMRGLPSVQDRPLTPAERPTRTDGVPQPQSGQALLMVQAGLAPPTAFSADQAYSALMARQGMIPTAASTNISPQAVIDVVNRVARAATAPQLSADQVMALQAQQQNQLANNAARLAALDKANAATASAQSAQLFMQVQRTFG